MGQLHIRPHTPESEPLDRLDDMGMRADDHVEPAVARRTAERARLRPREVQAIRAAQRRKATS